MSGGLRSILKTKNPNMEEENINMKDVNPNMEVEDPNKEVEVSNMEIEITNAGAKNPLSEDQSCHEENTEKKTDDTDESLEYKRKVERKYSPADVKTFIQHRKYPKGMCHNTKRALSKYSEKFMIIAKKLYYKGKQGPIEVLFDESKLDELFLECHLTVEGTHLGRNRTMRNMSKRYYYLGMNNYTIHRMKLCGVCRETPPGPRSADKNKSLAPQLQPIETSQPLEVVGADLLGPLPETTAGFQYILTLTCLFSNWIVAYPVKNKNPDEVVVKLIEFIYSFGLPMRVVTNGGEEFVKEANENLCSRLSIKDLFSCYPQTLTQVERSKKAIKTALPKLVNEARNNWDVFLGQVVYNFNTAKVASTKFSPYYIMFGRPPNYLSQVTEEEEATAAVAPQ